MGNWRTVTLVGTVSESEIPALIAKVTYGDRDWSNFGPLSYDPAHPSLCGLQGWIRPTIADGGNLAERDYGVDEVAEHLRTLVGIAPSLELKVHCGDEYESDDCVATVTVHAGDVTVGPPEVAKVSGVSEEDSRGRLLGYLYR